MVEDAFQTLFDQLDLSLSITSVDLHRQLLFNSSESWHSFRLDGTCLVCLRRTPQYGLPCGHSISHNCIQKFGKQSNIDPWLIEVESCFVCGLDTSGVVVKTTPRTAGIRVLTLDGGGVRGLEHLQYLQYLQDRIGLPFPVQENFDVVFGTSSGTSMNSFGMFS